MQQQGMQPHQLGFGGFAFTGDADCDPILKHHLHIRLGQHVGAAVHCTQPRKCLHIAPPCIVNTALSKGVLHVMLTQTV